MSLSLAEKIKPESSNASQLRPQITQEILRAVQDLRYGSVEIVIHDGRIVQIERKEKFRLQPEYNI